MHSALFMHSFYHLKQHTAVILYYSHMGVHKDIINIFQYTVMTSCKIPPLDRLCVLINGSSFLYLHVKCLCLLDGTHCLLHTANNLLIHLVWSVWDDSILIQACAHLHLLIGHMIWVSGQRSGFVGHTVNILYSAAGKALYCIVSLVWSL